MRQRIISTLLRILKEIKKENGYLTDIKEVVLNPAETIEIRDLPMIVVKESEDREEYLGFSYKINIFTITLSLFTFTQEAIYDLITDIKKALNGFFNEAEILDNTLPVVSEVASELAEKSFYSAKIDFEITYHDEGV